MSHRSLQSLVAGIGMRASLNTLIYAFVHTLTFEGLWSGDGPYISRWDISGSAE